MAVSDKERVSTVIGALLGCIVVGGLIQRRNNHRDARQSIAEAVVPEGAAYSTNRSRDFTQGEILHFKDHDLGRTWIVQYEKNYPFVQISETYSAISKTGGVSTFEFLAADRIIVKLAEGVTVKEFQSKLLSMGMHTGENFKKKGLVIAGLSELGVGKLDEAIAKIRSLEIVDSAEYDPIQGGVNPVCYFILYNSFQN